MSVPRYTDQFLNALMDSHGMTLRTELWFADALIGRLDVASGSVTADRGSIVRRTCDIVINPQHLDDPLIATYLNPYGSVVKMWRGVRFPDGTMNEAPIFTGRIDSVDLALDGLSLRCSDLAAQIVDARFPKQYQVTNATTRMTDLIRNLILDAMPAADVSIDLTSTALVRNGSTWEQERAEALDDLATQLGAEWFADMSGVFHLRWLPALITPTTPVEWIIDAGDSGVLIRNQVTQDRANVYNQVVVNGEAIGDVAGAFGEAHDTNPTSPTYWGGPYGKVPAIITGQTVSPNTTTGANALAKRLLAQYMSRTSSLSVTCVCNPKLQLGQVVRVFAPHLYTDGLYYVQSMSIPTTPDESMTITLNQTIEDQGELQAASLRVPEGAAWQPEMSIS